jgi:uncharacterized membrane protein
MDFRRKMNFKLKPALLIITGVLFLLAACASPAPAPTAAPTEAPVILPTDTLAPTPTEIAATDTPVPAPTETQAAAATTVSFINDVMPILQSRCFNCHGGEQTKEGLSFASYETLMQGSVNGLILVPGDANNSLFAQQLLKGEMPKRGPKLTPAQVQIIIDWINGGALNN